MSTDVEVEAVAEWISRAMQFGSIEGRTDPLSDQQREMARKALAAVEPLIRERLAQEVEAIRTNTVLPDPSIVRGDAS